MRVALIGPPQSGKSTLFAAVAEAGGSHVDLSRPDQPHLAVVKVPDERLPWLSDLEKSEKITPAEIEFLDLPGMDLSDQAGQSRARVHWPEMRQADMLVFVVRQFASDAAAPYRGRIDPAADVRELREEMNFAALEQATNRIEKLEAAVEKPTPKQDEQLRELELMKRIIEALEAEKPIEQAVRTEAEQKMLRSFALLPLKPTLVALNRSEDAAGEADPADMETLPCIGLSAKIEEEIAGLPAEERAAFLADLGLAAPARDRLIRACYRRMNLISFLTAGPMESRAWSIPAGTDAVTAAGTIHSDIARGFIRAETVAYEDLKATGSMKAAKAAGKIRLEGKNYIIKDGDVIYFRFNV